MRTQKLRLTLITTLLLAVNACAHRIESLPFTLPPEGSLSVVVKVTGARCCDGVLRLAVYNDEAYWLSSTDMVRGRLGFIQAETQTFEVHGLLAGKYAIAVYQDLDNDNKLDRWLGLLPSEPYGFSNNVGRYGPVSFEKAAFDLVEDETMTIQLNSW